MGDSGKSPPLRCLLAGTAYLSSPEKLWLASQWARIGATLNPGMDMLVVESPSPDGFHWEEIWKAYPEVHYIEQDTNIGHLAAGGQDGWGRDTMEAIRYAMDGGYDYLALIDTDVIFTRPLAPIFQHMEDTGAVALSEYSHFNYPHWLEALEFFSVPWLASVDFPARYGWQSMRPGMFPEERMEQAMGMDLEIYPLPGIRDDHKVVSRDTIRAMFPDGCAWLTHASREGYAALMEWYGLEEGCNL